MRFGSVCSGHDAVSQALLPRGWECSFLAEVEAFPCAILAERFGATEPRHHLNPAALPAKDRQQWISNNKELARMAKRGVFGDAVPNLGDFTKIDPAEWPDVEWLWGGTPCQAFSVAGARQGLKDHRGNLSLAFVGLAHDLAANGSLRGFTWENVPGVLSDKHNAFGCFLGALAGHDAPIISPHGKGRWPDAGVVVGPRCRLAWRILDTQHFGLPQRRRRVFVVGSFGDGPDPAGILFEREGVLGPAAARFGQRKRPAADAAIGAGISGEHYPPPVAHTLRADGFDASEDGTGRGTPLVPVSYCAPTLAGGGPHGHIDFESETFVAQPVGFANAGEHGAMREVGVADSLRATGGDVGKGGETIIAAPRAFSAMPMNSGKDFTVREADIAQPVLTAPGHGAQGGDYVAQPIPFDTTQITSKANRSHPKAGDPSHPLAATAHPPAIAFNARQDPDVSGDISGPLSTYSTDQAIAFSLRGRDGENQIEPEAGGVAPALRTGEGGSSKGFVAHAADAIRWAVRRLMPTECEALQGTARDFTRIPWRGKPADQCPDGPRYKVIGNAMSIEVLVWLGINIEEACRGLD